MHIKFTYLAFAVDRERKDACNLKKVEGVWMEGPSLTFKRIRKRCVITNLDGHS